MLNSKVNNDKQYQRCSSCLVMPEGKYFSRWKFIICYSSAFKLISYDAFDAWTV